MEMSYSMDSAMSNGTMAKFKASTMNDHQMHRLPFYTETCYKSFRKGFNALNPILIYSFFPLNRSALGCACCGLVVHCVQPLLGKLHKFYSFNFKHFYLIWHFYSLSVGACLLCLLLRQIDQKMIRREKCRESCSDPIELFTSFTYWISTNHSPFCQFSTAFLCSFFCFSSSMFLSQKSTKNWNYILCMWRE
jgi:hypothetical protein